MTYFVPDTSGNEVNLVFTQENGNEISSSAFHVNPLANEQWYNPPAIFAVNRIFITLYSGTIAINRITISSEPEG